MSKKLASEWAEMEGLRNDRPITPSRLKFYEEQLKAGELRDLSWAKTFCNETGKTYRLDGHHTSTVLAAVDDPALFKGLEVGIQSYVSPTLLEAARLYNTFDSPVGSRTLTNMLQATAASVPALSVIPVRVLPLVLGGITWGAFGPSGHTVPAAVRVAMLPDNIPFALWLFNMHPASAQAGFLRRRPVAGAMCVTWKKDRKAATKFWTAVRDETGTTPDLPDRKLAKWLSTTSLGVGNATGRPTGRAKTGACAREFYVRCLLAWNAWRAGKESFVFQYSPLRDVPTVV